MHCWSARCLVVVQRAASLQSAAKVALAYGGDLTEQSATGEHVWDDHERSARRSAAGADGGHDGDLYGGDGEHHRRHRDADHRRRARRVSAVQLGVCRLSLNPGGDDSDLRAPCRSLWQKARVFCRRRLVHGGLDLVRPGLGDGAADPVPGLARGRRRSHPADRDDHHRRHLSADRTRPDPGLHLGRVRRGGDHRPDARRLSGPARDLVAGVLDQPADRGGDLCHVRSVPARAANSAPPPHRLSRLGLDDAGRRRADVGAGGGREFGRDADGRGARCGRPRRAGGVGRARTGGRQSRSCRCGYGASGSSPSAASAGLPPAW